MLRGGQGGEARTVSKLIWAGQGGRGRRARDAPDRAGDAAPKERLAPADEVDEEAEEDDRGDGLERAIYAGVERGLTEEAGAARRGQEVSVGQGRVSARRTHVMPMDLKMRVEK